MAPTNKKATIIVSIVAVILLAIVCVIAVLALATSLSNKRVSSFGEVPNATATRVTVTIATATQEIEQTSTQESMPGLTGVWKEPDLEDTFTIAWQDGKYVVISVTWKDNSYSILSQSWLGNTLKWTYFDTTLNYEVTYETTSLDGDILYAMRTDGYGGVRTEDLVRQP